jgi:hypothetical protein
MSQPRERPGTIRLLPTALIAAFLAMITGVLPAEAASSVALHDTRAETSAAIQQLRSHATPGSDRPAAHPDETQARISELETCTEPDAEGASVCVQETAPADLPARPPQNAPTAQASVDPPQWCEDSKGKILATRTQVCLVSGLTYTTRQSVNGQTTVTGQANMIVINYSYSDTGLGTFAHQIEVSAYGG